jgi:hypothetical protein
MDKRSILAALDTEISDLQKVRALLTGSNQVKPTKIFKTVSAKRVRGKLSAEAIERIRAGQKKRWAKVRRAKKAAAVGVAVSA